MMEGGMVAIVQGLTDSGLAVTLMNSYHLQNSLKPRALPTSKSSVETSTNLEHSGRNTTAQAHDDHYTSSYQMAHCNVRPSSPPERLAEFTPQRTEPCRSKILGNFQSGEFNKESYNPPTSQIYGGQSRGLMWPDRGSLSGRLSPPSQCVPSTDPFVHSLRRYPLPSPSVSPESISSELVQRLLNYTQNKHLSRASNRSRSPEEKPTRDQKTDTTTKNIQTYTRTKNQITRDCGANTHNDIRFGFGKKGRLASTSPYLRTTSEHHNDAYDYLKSSRRGRCPEVRYFNDVKKVIRDTIKQIYDDKPVVCPQIKRRYSQHKKQHHQNSQEFDADAQCPEEVTAGTSTESAFVRCRPPTEIPKCRKRQVCRSCETPVTCPCPLDSFQESTTTPDILVSKDKTKETKSKHNTAVDEIFEWLKSIPVYADDSQQNKKKREEMVKDLADKLNGLERDELYELSAKDEIKKCIEKLPMWYPGAKRDQEMFKNQIADDLFTRLTDVESVDDFKDAISQWVNEIPFEKDAKVDRDEVVERLIDLLKPLVHNPGQMKTEIKDLIEGLPVVNKRKVINKLADKLTDDLAEVTDKTALKISTDSVDEELENPNQSRKEKNRKKSLEEQRRYEDLIWGWLDELLDIPKVDKQSHQKLVKNFANKLQELQTENADDEVLEEEINDFINSLSKKGVTVRNKDKLAKKLIQMISTLQTNSFRQDEELQQSILNEISELVEDIPSNISKSKRNDIKDKVTEVMARNINNLSNKTDNINQEIFNILKKEAKMLDNEAYDLASAIVSRVKGMPLLDKSKYSVSGIHIKTDNEIKHLVTDEVSDILNEFNISTRKKKDLEWSITEVLADQIIRGTDNKKTRDEIISILEKANVSEDDALNISKRLLERNNELSLSYKSRDSKLGIRKPRLSGATFKSISPQDRHEFEERAEREIMDFIEDVTCDDSPRSRSKRKEATEQLVHRLGEIMSNPDDIDKEKSIIEEVSQYLEKLSVEVDMSREVMAKQLAKRLQGVGMQASTPKKDQFSFYPRRDSIDISAIHLDDDNLRKNSIKSAQDIFDEEKKFVHDLIQLINSWIDELPINLSAPEDKGFKETMAQDLASDIVDRQKYIQINPEAISSHQEELEHLKYQLFRWLNKLLDIDDLSSIMQRTDTLMTKIKDLNVPELIKPIRKRTVSKSGKDLIPNSMESIRDEISTWMDEIPEDIYTSTDKDFLKPMIHELAVKIQQFRVKNQSENISYEISNWLSKLIKEVDQQKLAQMTDALEARLKQRGLTEASVMLDQDSSQFVEENLFGAIKDWVKSIPLFKKPIITQKQELEGLIQELANGLKSVFATTQSSIEDADQIYIDEIRKHLEMFPMDAEHKSDLTFLERVSTQLLRFLKDLQIFANISDRQEKPVHGYLEENVEEWIDSLPITRIDSAEEVQFETLKKEFINKLKKLRQEDALNERKIKDEIRNYLQRFPIKENMKQDTKFTNDKVEQLYKNLLAVPVETYLEPGSDKFVKNVVFDWLKSLPLDKSKTVNDISSNAIDELISRISNLIVKTDVIQISEIKNTVEDAIGKFLKSVPLDPHVDVNVKSLADALFKNVREMSRKRSSVTKPPTRKKAAEILFDDIENWVNNLPLKEDAPEAIKKAKRVKQDIASKLIHTIGELNMNPEVFNDDFLYDDMLEDEIDYLLTDLSSEDVKNNLPTIKADLMEKVKEARQKTHEEVAGQAYKQQLREAILKALPSESLTAEEQASFEVLKDNLADAFITLHYVGDDIELKTRYRTKINEEVSKFCNDYLKKHPASPIDSKKLNQDLYNALKGVPLPKEETVRNEVELVKIKDEVNDWIKALPLTEQTAAEKVQTTKMVAVLAKKLHDIEKQKELAPESDYEIKMRKEITKWLKKLPLEINEEKAIELTEKLVDNLKNTEHSRRVSASTRHSIDPDVFDATPDTLAPVDTKPQPPKTCKTDICRSRYMAPLSNLSIEDHHHLQKIRERSLMPRPKNLKDASVSPPPVDAGSQTEVRPWEQPVCGKRQSQSSGVQTLIPPEEKSMQAVGSQAEVTPHVIVKEYYWDAAEAKMGVCATCPRFAPSPQTKSAGVCSPSPSQFATPSQTPQMRDRTSQLSQGSQSPHMDPQGTIPCELTPRQPRYARKAWEHFPGPEIDQEPSTSQSFQSPRITRLGSFDDVETKSKEARKYPSRDWAKFAEDAWDKRSDEFIKERKRDEKVRCRCRERILTKCAGKRGRVCSPCQDDDVKMCSKCCGVHCPYPSYLYFRK